MSATNRGGERNESDFYPTPRWPVHRFLERYPLPGGRWIEPGAGEGHIIRAVNEVRSDVLWTACELRDECTPLLLAAGAADVRIGNFMGATLEWAGLTERAAVAFGNPPFRWALEFIHIARMLAEYVVLLLRLDFMASADRAPLMLSAAPDLCPLPDRISFSGSGSTDSTDYGWFVWPPRVRPEGRLIPLATTPLETRKAQLVTPSLQPMAVVQQEMFA